MYSMVRDHLIISTFPLSGNGVCILVLTQKKKDLGLKPSFTNLLILLVRSKIGEDLQVVRIFSTLCELQF